MSLEKLGEFFPMILGTKEEWPEFQEQDGGFNRHKITCLDTTKPFLKPSRKGKFIVSAVKFISCTFPRSHRFRPFSSSPRRLMDRLLQLTKPGRVSGDNGLHEMPWLAAVALMSRKIFSWDAPYLLRTLFGFSDTSVICGVPLIPMRL